MRQLAILLVFLTVGLTVTGCRQLSPERNCPPDELWVRQPWQDLCTVGPPPVVEEGFASQLSKAVQRAASADVDDPRPALNVLAISGGGAFGAFSVGVLNGWTASGQRPRFDVVTGVSTGALVATYAFLGPQYDAHLKQLFTNITDEDIYESLGILPVLLRGNVSYASNEPLKQIIRAQATPELLQEVAQQHALGRRLYVASTNLDTRRMVIWDMGAIAQTGDTELYSKILIASAAIPGFFPPERFDIEVDGDMYTELHVDGGVTAAVFVQEFMLDLNGSPHQGAPPGSRVWVIASGKLYTDPECVDPTAFAIAGDSLSSLVYSLTRADIFRIFTLCLLAGADFNLTAVPHDFPVNPASFEFDREALCALYRVGCELGLAGPQGWRKLPPGTQEFEQSLPRTGTQFRTTNPADQWAVTPRCQ